MKLKVVYVKPNCPAATVEIKNDLHEMQKMVDGFVEVIYPFPDEVCIICNEEGKIRGMEPNRKLLDKTGKIADILFGPFIIAGLTDEKDDFTDLTDELAEKYMKMYSVPDFQ